MIIESLWTITSFTGFVTTMWLLREAYRDRNELTRTGRNGPSMLIARSVIRTEIIRGFKLLVMTVIGVLSFIVERPAREDIPDVQGVTFSDMVITMLILVAVLTVANALNDRFTRHRVGREIEKIYREGKSYRGVTINEGE